MDAFDRLDLKNITDDDIHKAWTRFAVKWQDKAARSDRISR